MCVLVHVRLLALMLFVPAHTLACDQPVVCCSVRQMGFFRPQIDSVVAHLTKMQRGKQLEGVGSLFLVGGFAASEVLQ